MRLRDRLPLKGPRARRTLVLAAAVLVVATTIAVAAPLVATSSPDFFARYHLLERRYVNLVDSAHEGISCRTCHETNAVRNGLQLISDYYVSFVRRDAVPEYFTFQPPTREACLSCHKGDWSMRAERTGTIPHPAHLRVAEETRECVSCHKWTAHFETYMEKHKTMPFSGVCVAYGCHVGTKTVEQCFDCHHVLHAEADQWRTRHPQVARATGQAACLEACHDIGQCQMCHTTGEVPEFDGLPIEVSMKSIEQLHVKPEWTERYHGVEALKARDNCLLCHQSEGECGECHRERPASHGSTTTWIGRHKNHTDRNDDPRCIECHQRTWCEDCHAQFKEMG